MKTLVEKALEGTDAMYNTYTHEDIKEAVLEFEIKIGNWLLNPDNSKEVKNSFAVNDKVKELSTVIFGDFDND